MNRLFKGCQRPPLPCGPLPTVLRRAAVFAVFAILPLFVISVTLNLAVIQNPSIASNPTANSDAFAAAGQAVAGAEAQPTLIILSSEADRDYILFLFLDLLEREPTEAETTAFLEMLSTGKTRDDLQEHIFESPEFKARLAAMDEAFEKAAREKTGNENGQPPDGQGLPAEGAGNDDVGSTKSAKIPVEGDVIPAKSDSPEGFNLNGGGDNDL